ncbi:MAG: GNAT family N-acetyltransferase [bacterium]
MSISFRSVGNESELEQVMGLMQQANPDSDPQRMAARITKAPNYDLWQTRVAAENGKIIAALQIFDRQMWLNGEKIKLAGLGNLSVHPEFKNRFNATELIKDTLGLLKEFEYPLSVVLTRDNTHYEKFGYFVMPALEYSFDKISGYDTTGVRPFDRAKDLAEVAKIYEAFNSQRNGPFCRSDQDWENQLQWGNDDASAFWVLENEGQLNAYVRGRVKQGVVEVLEFGGWKSYASFFRRLLVVMFEELDFHTAKISLRREEPFFNAAYIPARQAQDTRMMWAVLDERKLQENLDMNSAEEVQHYLKQLRDFQITFWYTDAF